MPDNFMKEDKFNLHCKECDVLMTITININPKDNYGDIGPRPPMLEKGGWTCPNCASQSVDIKKIS